MEDPAFIWIEMHVLLNEWFLTKYLQGSGYLRPSLSSSLLIFIHNETEWVGDEF